jgi:hypothetical protein
MQYKTFKQIVDTLKKTHDNSLKLYKLGIDLSVSVEDGYCRVITALFGVYYGVEGEDVISWWLYEDVEKIVYTKDKSGKSRPRNLHTIKQLWEYVEELRKDEGFKEYEFSKSPLS